jgi:hypothetical protein
MKLFKAYLTLWLHLLPHLGKETFNKTKDCEEETFSALALGVPLLIKLKLYFSRFKISLEY